MLKQNIDGYRFDEDREMETFVTGWLIKEDAMECKILSQGMINASVVSETTWKNSGMAVHVKSKGVP